MARKKQGAIPEDVEANKLNDLIIKLEKRSKVKHIMPEIRPLILKVKKLSPTTDQLNEIIELHPEIQDDIENVIKLLANDKNIKSIYQGVVKTQDEERIFYAIRGEQDKDKITIIIPGEGLQEIISNGKEEIYKRRQNNIYFVIRSKILEDNKKNVSKETKSVYYTKKQVDSYYDVFIACRRNQAENFGLTKEDYPEPLIKETGIFTKDTIDSISYAELYKDRMSKKPDRLVLKEAEKITRYLATKKGNKYVDMSNPKSKPITLDDFEAKIERIYGITKINQSELNQYFNEGNFQIPAEIEEIVSTIQKLEQPEKENDGNGGIEK